MQVKKHLYISASVLLLAVQLRAQDTHYSQYPQFSAAINPALAGVDYDTRVTAGYRTQWGSVAKAYQNYGVVLEQSLKYKKLKGSHLAIMASLFKDVAGDAKLSNINPNLGLCYVQKISKTTKFSGALQGGFMYKTIDVNALKWDRQFDGYAYDPSRPTGEEGNMPRSAMTSYDLGGGINFNYSQSERFISAKDGNKANAGFSFYHAQMPRNSFYQSSEQLYMRYSVYANAEISIPRTKNAIMPSFIVTRQGPSTEILLGAMFKWVLADQSVHTSLRKPAALAIGGQYRYKDAIVPTVLYQYNKYAIGISYDINVSALTPASKRMGGLEIMLRYNTSPGYGKNLGRGDSRASY
jgi:type IX secretion system PorP/SprF family membrane protein